MSSGPSSPVFHGRLDRIGLADLLEALAAGRATGTLTVGKAIQARIRVEDGRVVSARWGEHAGAAALARALRLRDGPFSFVAEPGRDDVSPHDARAPAARGRGEERSWRRSLSGTVRMTRAVSLTSTALTIIALVGAWLVVSDRLPGLRRPDRGDEVAVGRDLAERNARARAQIRALQQMTRELSSSITAPAPHEERAVVSAGPSVGAEPETPSATPLTLRTSAPAGAAAEREPPESAEGEAPAGGTGPRPATLSGTRFLRGGEPSRLELILPWALRGTIQPEERPVAVLEVRVGVSGRVEETRLEMSSGRRQLDSLALAAITRVRYTATRQGRAAVPAWTRQEISFRPE